MVSLLTPSAPATKKQLWRLHQLTGEDTTKLIISMQEASNRIQQLELDALESQVSAQATLDENPFEEPKITIVEGDQRGGKTVYCVGKIIEAYRKDCVKIYYKDVLKIDCEVKAYYKQDRVAKIKVGEKLQYIQIPSSYELKSPMRIFSNIHLFGVPYVYIPTFRHMLAWLKNGFISRGLLLSDETHRGMSARATQTEEGREWVGEYFQFGKSKLEVYLITHHARMIDLLARMIPTKRVFCRYEKETHRVFYTVKQKNQAGEKEYSFDASQYFGNYKTNEKVNA